MMVCIEVYFRFLVFHGILIQVYNAQQSDCDSIDSSLRTKVCALENLVNTILMDKAKDSKLLNNLQRELNEVKNKYDTEIQSLEYELMATKNAMRETVKEVQVLEKTLGMNESVVKDLFQKRMLLPVTSSPMRSNGIGFSASLNRHLENLGIHQVIVFDNVITNYGSGYDKITGVFKAPVSGLYFFNVVIMSHNTEDIETQIVKNGIQLVNTYSGDSTTWNQGTQSTVVYLNPGDDVYVHIQDNKGINDGNIRVFGGHWSSFSGFLISF